MEKHGKLALETCAGIVDQAASMPREEALEFLGIVKAGVQGAMLALEDTEHPHDKESLLKLIKE